MEKVRSTTDRIGLGGQGLPREMIAALGFRRQFLRSLRRNEPRVITVSNKATAGEQWLCVSAAKAAWQSRRAWNKRTPS